MTPGTPPAVPTTAPSLSVGDLISQSLRTTTQNRSLWLLAFLTGLLSTGINFSVNPGLGQFFQLMQGSFSSSSYLNNPLYTDSTVTSWNTLAGCLTLLLTIGFFFVAGAVQGGLVHASDRALQGHAPDVRESLAVGRARMWPIVGLNAVLLGIGLAIGIVFAILVFCALGAAVGAMFTTISSSLAQPGSTSPTATPDLGPMMGGIALVGCLSLFLLLPIIIALGMIVQLGQRAVVLHNYNFGQAWSAGWTLLRAHLGTIIVLLIVQFVIGLLFGALAAGVNFTLATVPAGMLASGTGGAAVVGVAIVVGLLVWLLNGLIIALPTAWAGTLWTLLYRQATPGWPVAQPAYAGGYPAQYPSAGYNQPGQYPGTGYTQPGQYGGGYTQPGQPPTGGYTQPGQYPTGGYTPPGQYRGSYGPPPTGGYTQPGQYPGGYTPPADTTTPPYPPESGERARGGPESGGPG